jgi:hypothetical protein
VILSLIAATTSVAGLTVESYLDTAAYPTGVTVSDKELAALHIERDAFLPEWNYIIQPRAA